MSARQCPSCGGFCRKSGCERLNTNHPDYDKTEWKVRGVLAESLKCWCRLTGEEAAELVELLAKTGAQMHAAYAAGAASRDSEIEALRADAARYRWLRDHVIFGYPSSEGSSNKAAYLVVTGYGYRERKNLTDQAVDAASAAEGEAP